MLYLVTGGNGACKTLLALRWVRDLQLETGRPVYFHGFKAKQPLLDFGWIERDPREWESFPDGSIVLWDEAHNFLPVRSRGEPPQYVRMLAEHRARGFDFFVLDQHPMNIDAFVRRLVAVPGWHRHLKRSPTGNLVSVLTFASVNPQCEKMGSGDDGEVKMVAMPKEVYDWYDSAFIHTGKPRMPKAVYVLAAAVVLVPLLGWVAWSSLMSWGKRGQAAAGSPAAAGARAPGAAGTSGGAARAPVRTARDWVAEHRPRIEGLAYTAPRYDSITVPSRAPVIVGCWSQGEHGWCISQQGTRLDVPRQVRESFIVHGQFLDFEPGPAPGEGTAANAGPAGRGFSPGPSIGQPVRGPQSGA